MATRTQEVSSLAVSVARGSQALKTRVSTRALCTCRPGHEGQSLQETNVRSRDRHLPKPRVRWRPVPSPPTTLSRESIHLRRSGVRLRATTSRQGQKLPLTNNNQTRFRRRLPEGPRLVPSGGQSGVTSSLPVELPQRSYWRPYWSRSFLREVVALPHHPPDLRLQYRLLPLLRPQRPRRPYQGGSPRTVTGLQTALRMGIRDG